MSVVHLNRSLVRRALPQRHHYRLLYIAARTVSVTSCPLSSLSRSSATALRGRVRHGSLGQSHCKNAALAGPLVELLTRVAAGNARSIPLAIRNQ